MTRSALERFEVFIEVRKDLATAVVLEIIQFCKKQFIAIDYGYKVLNLGWPGV